ncbi:MAG TPA: glycine cleavage T C-terminal barrel domain-containing protein [Myxococcota bacterium]|nr:glycine cleavage T C-terminal barrel domain-containing protein [Myxococcota bacterium]
MASEFKPLIAIGPRVRKSPFFEATLRHGAKSFTVYNHMYMPTGFSSPESEYWSLVNDVTLWDVACERQIEITGPDAARFAQYLTPRNLSKCRVGRCLYVVLCDEDGGIVNDAVLLRLAENHFWLSPGDGDVLLWAQGAAIHSGMKVSIDEPDVSPLQLQGPKSPAVARALFGDWALELGYFELRETQLDDIPVVLARTGWSGEIGYEIYLRDGRRGDELWERAMAAGKPFGIAPIAPSMIRSIEAGMLSYGADITRADDPISAGMERLIDLDQQADFIGKQALRRIRERGVSRRLVAVEIAGAPLEAPNQHFWPVLAGSRVVGHVTRCVYSPRLEKNIGFANVSADCSAIGTELALDAPGGRRRARVARSPFTEAKKEIGPDLER